MASLFGLGGAGGAAAAGMASKVGLFKPSSIAQAVGSSIKGTVGKKITETASGIVGGKGGKIDWTVYNFPSKLEFLSIIHFDLAELKEKRDAAVYHMVLWSYRWWLATLALCGINFIDTCILAGTVVGYAGYHVIISLVWTLVWAAGGMAVVYMNYHGVAEGSLKSKIAAKVGVMVLIILVLIHVFAHFGNINGITGFGSQQFAHVKTLGASDSSVTFWEAVTALESLLWLGDGCWLGWFAFRIFKGPSVANAQVELSS